MTAEKVHIKPNALRDIARKIVLELRHAGHEAYFVGGCVRDIVRGVEPSDFDIVTSAHPENVQTLFKKTVPVGARFGVMLVIEEGLTFEVATFRTEADYRDGRRPGKVSFANAEEDIKRRDFTINGLLLDPETGQIIDYTTGKEDIARRLIRTIGDPGERFAEDHLRMIRAVRFAANLGFAIDPLTMKAIKEFASCINKISAERIRDELEKLLTRGDARRSMELLDESGLLCEILPEIHALKGVEQPEKFHPEGDVWEHTLRMLSMMAKDNQGVADNRLTWAVLLHDAGKAITRSQDDSGVHFYGHAQQGVAIANNLMKRLRFSRQDQETITALIHDHMRFMHVAQMRPNTLKKFLRMPDFPLHLELHRLDCLGSHGMLGNHEICREMLAEFPQEELHPPRLLSGDDLIAMGFKPGPLFSRILRDLEDAQLSGEVNTSQDARRLITNLYTKEENLLQGK